MVEILKEREGLGERWILKERERERDEKKGREGLGEMDFERLEEVDDNASISTDHSEGKPLL